MNKLIIIGASGHGKVVADIALHCGYTKLAFFDDNPAVKSCMNYPVIGTSADAGKYPDCDFIIAVGNGTIREKIQKKLQQEGLHIVALVHPSAVIANEVHIGIGTVVMAGAVINPCTVIGDGCIINTCSSVDHDCVIADFAHISVGAHIAGTVHVGKRTWIGAGAVVSNDVRICADCMIGAGAVVIRDIEESGTYVGVPARKLRREQNV